MRRYRPVRVSKLADSRKRRHPFFIVQRSKTVKTGGTPIMDRLNLHDFLFLGDQQLVDFGDRIVGNLLHLFR